MGLFLLWERVREFEACSTSRPQPVGDAAPRAQVNPTRYISDSVSGIRAGVIRDAMTSTNIVQQITSNRQRIAK